MSFFNPSYTWMAREEKSGATSTLVFLTAGGA